MAKFGHKFAMKDVALPPPPDTVVQHAHDLLQTRNRQWQAREKLLEQADGVEDICVGGAPKAPQNGQVWPQIRDEGRGAAAAAGHCGPARP